jgi:hypothetical protein
MNRLTAVSPLRWERYDGFYIQDFGTLHRLGWRVNLNLGSQHFRGDIRLAELLVVFFGRIGGNGHSEERRRVNGNQGVANSILPSI